MSWKLDTARKGADGQTAKPWRISSPSASSSSGPSVTSPRSRRCDRLDRLSPCPLAPTTHDLYESIDGQCAPWIALLGSTPVIVTYAGIHIYNFRRPFAFAPHISPHVHMFACYPVRLSTPIIEPHHVRTLISMHILVTQDMCGAFEQREWPVHRARAGRGRSTQVHKVRNGPKRRFRRGFVRGTR